MPQSQAKFELLKKDLTKLGFQICFIHAEDQATKLTRNQLI